jgi:hypothetical protein
MALISNYLIFKIKVRYFFHDLQMPNYENVFVLKTCNFKRKKKLERACITISLL